MAVGIAAMVWGYQTYQYSFSFDNFHKDRDHVYLVIAPLDRVLTESDLKTYIEREIAYQDREQIPNYYGLEWKSS